MSNGDTTAVEFRDLSSNWRKLQKTLKQDTSKPSKRKAPQEILQPRLNGVKYQKLNPAKGAAVSESRDDINGLGKMESVWSSTKKSAPSASLALWAEDNDISAKDLAAAYGTSLESSSIFPADTTKDTINGGLSSAVEAGKYIAIDCEMVGVGPTPDSDSALARVSIVNYHGHQLYDSFVLPKEAVTDYRTFVSGIIPELLKDARTLEAVQADVAKLLDGRILIGHAIRNDLSALLLGHSKRDIRDTSRHPAFRALAGGKTPGLKRLARQLLGVEIQGGEHSSIEDARATMLLFRKYKQEFESEHLKKWGPDHKGFHSKGEDKTEIDGTKHKKHRKKKRSKK